MIRTLAPWTCAVLAVAVGACGAVSEDPPPDDMPPPDCLPGECEVDGLDSALGCGGIYNPDQVLDYHLTMSSGDWSSLKSDATFETYFPAQFQCGDDPPLNFDVGVRRKRSGSTDKPGMKVDFNKFTPGGSFFSIKKLSLENGVSSGSDTAEPGEAVSEYVAWRMMVLSGAISSRAAFARVFVNGELIGTYVNVEQVDKRFLRSRGQDDEGWLFKLSGGVDDGYKTSELTPNPYEDRACFFDKNPCPAPSAAELATYLPENVDVEQLMLFGGVNAIIANSDAPFYKDNNFYWYDDPVGSPRLYMPWDLDTTMKDSAVSLFGTGSTLYTSVLFTNWEDDYDLLLTELLAGPLAEDVIVAELDRIEAVAAAALDSDPAFTGGGTSGVVADLKAWWSARLTALDAELDAHAP